ncbi:hypothetical protein Scep_009141 [Stephania cephalantha]|uniref:Uncharacterized protein n=1 Tax=Stephania cephalantha TaxID=152367 RepID=A0AAP0JTJ1_9MAGN
MAFLLPIFALSLAFNAYPSLSLSTHLKLATSTISAAPAFLPNPPPLPSPSPNFAPNDENPLFPTPKTGTSSQSPNGEPTPTIPSNPSPPNPDEMLSPGPFSADAPSGSIHAMSSPASLNSSFGMLNFCGSFVGVVLMVVVVWLKQLFC